MITFETSLTIFCSFRSLQVSSRFGLVKFYSNSTVIFSLDYPGNITYMHASEVQKILSSTMRSKKILNSTMRSQPLSWAFHLCTIRFFKQKEKVLQITQQKNTLVWKTKRAILRYISHFPSTGQNYELSTTTAALFAISPPLVTRISPFLKTLRKEPCY